MSATGENHLLVVPAIEKYYILVNKFDTNVYVNLLSEYV